MVKCSPMSLRPLTPFLRPTKVGGRLSRSLPVGKSSGWAYDYAYARVFTFCPSHKTAFAGGIRRKRCGCRNSEMDLAALSATWVAANDLTIQFGRPARHWRPFTWALRVGLPRRDAPSPLCLCHCRKPLRTRGASARPDTVLFCRPSVNSSWSFTVGLPNHLKLRTVQPIIARCSAKTRFVLQPGYVSDSKDSEFSARIARNWRVALHWTRVG